MADKEDGQIRLTGELVDKIMETLVAHEAHCDTGLVACQYLSAVQAMLICRRVAQPKDRESVVAELSSFLRYAVEDMGHAAPAPPPSQNAFGIWKPGEE